MTEPPRPSPVVDRDTWTAQVNELRVRETSHTRDAPSLVSESMGSVVKALVAVAAELTAQIAGLEARAGRPF